MALIINKKRKNSINTPTLVHIYGPMGGMFSANDPQQQVLKACKEKENALQKQFDHLKPNRHNSPTPPKHRLQQSPKTVAECEDNIRVLKSSISEQKKRNKTNSKSKTFRVPSTWRKPSPRRYF
jgi:hypothetical protein